MAEAEYYDEDFDSYINAEFVSMVTSESWDFPTPYWEVDESENIIPNMQISSNFFIVFPTVIDAIEDFIERLKRGDNGNENTGY